MSDDPCRSSVIAVSCRKDSGGDDRAEVGEATPGWLWGRKAGQEPCFPGGRHPFPVRASWWAELASAAEATPLWSASGGVAAAAGRAEPPGCPAPGFLFIPFSLPASASQGSHTGPALWGHWGENPKVENSSAPCLVRFLLLRLLCGCGSLSHFLLPAPASPVPRALPSPRAPARVSAGPGLSPQGRPEELPPARLWVPGRAMEAFWTGRCRLSLLAARLPRFEVKVGVSSLSGCEMQP